MTSKTNSGLWLMAFLPLVSLGLSQGQSDTIPSLLLALFIILPSAKLAGLAAGRLGQPAVMCELIVGMFLGNLGLGRLQGLEYLKTASGIEILGTDR